MAGVVVAVVAPGMLDSELLGVDDKPHVGLGWGGLVGPKAIGSGLGFSFLFPSFCFLFFYFFCLFCSKLNSRAIL